MAKRLRNRVKVGRVDASVVKPHPLVERFNIDKYPSLKFFGPGAKSDKSVISYKSQDLKTEELTEWALREKIRV